MLLRIHPENPGQRHINMVVECLNDGGIIIYPTDTVYGMGCSIFKPKSVEKIATIKGLNLKKSNFSFICADLKHISDYTKPFENHIYRLMRKTLPGPYTFILNANNNVPKLFQSKKKTVGIRVPKNNIVTEIVTQLGNPILTTSVHDDDDVLEYTTDPELIYEKFKNQVDIVINGGYGDNEASTVVDCTSGEIMVLRQGKGQIENYL